ncbi:helix-turn-helix domain-containing protein [Ruegeria sp.]|uniref:helix-turn-helix domain-containing protein n=1 Tax=Ruegeria sp. TaxID=1879320 RepID=UPI003B002098
MSFGTELIHSAEEALAIAKGEMEPAGAFIPETVDVAAVRKKQKLSQTDFAERYGLPVATLRDWEQKRRLPDRAAMVLIALIERKPKMVADTLAAS